MAQLRQLIDARQSKALIEVDGGINLETGAEVVAAGADVLVAGNFVFKASDPAAAIANLSRLS